MSEILPAIFFGRRHPMNALSDNHYNLWMAANRRTNAQAQGDSVDFRALVCPRNRRHHQYVSANHSRFRRLSARTLRVQYPAPGDPELARRVQSLLQPCQVKSDNAWGLDHGTWSVLKHVYPDADIPVVQLSIDETQPASFPL